VAVAAFETVVAGPSHDDVVPAEPADPVWEGISDEDVLEARPVEILDV
jgi:hypothetical protein